MFSSIFGKRRSSPIEVEVEGETPPIPGARPDDGFVVVDPSSPRNSLYPNVSGAGISAPYAQRPAPPAPTPRTALIDPTFHYLQGVPFAMSKTLQMASNKDTFATEIADLLAFLTNKVNILVSVYVALGAGVWLVCNLRGRFLLPKCICGKKLWIIY